MSIINDLLEVIAELKTKAEAPALDALATSAREVAAKVNNISKVLLESDRPVDARVSMADILAQDSILTLTQLAEKLKSPTLTPKQMQAIEEARKWTQQNIQKAPTGNPEPQPEQAPAEEDPKPVEPVSETIARAEARLAKPATVEEVPDEELDELTREKSPKPGRPEYRNKFLSSGGTPGFRTKREADNAPMLPSLANVLIEKEKRVIDRLLAWAEMENPMLAAKISVGREKFRVSGDVIHSDLRLMGKDRRALELAIRECFDGKMNLL